MKKIATIALVILLFFCTVIPVFAAGNADFVINLASGQAKPGDEIVVTVAVSMDAECSSMGFRPQFDASVLEIVSGECLIKNAVLSDFSKKEGAAVLLESPTAFNGDLCRFTLRVKDGAPAGTTEVGGKCAAKNGAETLQYSLKSATITIAVTDGSVPDNTEETNVSWMPTMPTSVSVPLPEVDLGQIAPDESQEAETTQTEDKIRETVAGTEGDTLTIGAMNTIPEREFPVGALVILLLLVAALIGVLIYSRKRK